MHASSLQSWLLLMIIGNVTAVSYNQPKFCPTASWDPNAFTFANITMVSSTPYDIFINTNNTMYVTDVANSQIQIWYNESINLTDALYAYNASALFVTIAGDIYVETGSLNGRVDKWVSDTNNSIPVMYTCSRCYDIFIDSNNNLYCSIHGAHMVISKPLDVNSTSFTIVAGTGEAGNTTSKLQHPWGIFMSTHFSLYVADRENNRIQLFQPGQSNATTVAGSGASGTISLNSPTGIALDTDNYLFIVDHGNNRIVGSGPNGFRCLVGCSSQSGLTADTLNYPKSMAFDSYGNIFVTDTLNSRIQKFLLATNSCDQTTEPMTTTMSSVEIYISSIQSSTLPTHPATTNTVTVPRLEGPSYNQPKLSPSATWSANAVTFANTSVVGTGPLGIFVHISNTIYVASKQNNEVLIYSPDNILVSSRTLGVSSIDLVDIFVTFSGDLFVSDTSLYQVVKLASSTTTTRFSMVYVDTTCFGLFIDIRDIIYCSIFEYHQVITKPLNGDSNLITVVAGIGCNGASTYKLDGPKGIFVDTKFNLYVADYWNNRVQLFRPGQLDAITVAGNGASGAIVLQHPIGVALDAENYLFIVDCDNHRIVGSGPNGFRCLVGCSGSYNSASNGLHFPQAMAFDSYGNMFVADFYNNRIQKFILLDDNLVPTYNQPKLCPSSTWSPYAITFATSELVGSLPYSIYIDTNNRVYVVNQDIGNILIWSHESLGLMNNISSNATSPNSLFVTSDGNIYISNGENNGEVDVWTGNATNSISVMLVNKTCYGLFVDTTRTLYCSMKDDHRVVKRWLKDQVTTLTTVAGDGTNGSADNALAYPQGIFVDINFDLYVADCGNDRVQLFHLGQSSALTVAGSGATGTISLDCPTGIVLDADKNLFIVDSNNHRIVASGFTGFRCLVGCSGSSTGASNDLSYPQTMAFDSYGNIFVTDRNNSRIQKFLLATNSCVLSYNQPKFSSCALWDTNATTLPSDFTNNSAPLALFVDRINTIYTTNQNNSYILVWPPGSDNATKTLFSHLNYSKSLFVVNNGDIYFDTGFSQVELWPLNANRSQIIMNATSNCYGLFVDIYNTLYCSLSHSHQVVKLLLNSNTTTPTAGNGSEGTEPNMLSHPHGIFVDITLNLYVADCGNDRIQRFQFGQLIGTTVAGNGSTGNIILHCPTGVILDADNNLFIVDRNNHRIVTSNSLGLRCLLGCSNSPGSQADQLDSPNALAFDSFGDIFVADSNNSRVQKFRLKINSCETTTTALEQSTVNISSTDYTSSSSRETSSTTNTPPSSFVVRTCPNHNTIGIGCKTSIVPCAIFEPCQNNGSCSNSNTTLVDYTCTCQRGFNGIQCQSDNRPCQGDTCWNNGICNETSNETFECSCQQGWKGLRCEAKVNYCANITCLNYGVCRPSFLNYTCECVGAGYSGRHCEIVETVTVIHQVVSRSFGYIAILFLTTIVSFFVIMDILKYCFGIDPARDELERFRKRRAARRVKPRPVIRRYIYVNEPLGSSLTASNAEDTLETAETTV